MVLAASPRAKPGTYAVTISATSAAGEQRQTTLTVVVHAMTTVPSGSTRNPVVLLNGWEAGYNAQRLSHIQQLGGYVRQSGPVSGFDDGVPVVYLFDNCLVDPSESIETLGNDLATFLNSIQYDTARRFPKSTWWGLAWAG